MALIIPHQSNQGIANASGGQAAQYRSASAFMTPGQENLGQGLQQFAAGLNKLNGVVFEAEVKKRQEQMELDAMRDVQDAISQDAAWRAEYQNTYQGENARDAADQYAVFSSELAGTLREKYRNNPHALQYVESRMGNLSLSGTGAMRSYSDQQDTVYRTSLVDKQYSLVSKVYANPSSTPEERMQSSRDYTALKTNLLSRQGYDQEAARIAAQDDLRKLDQQRAMDEHAMLRQRDPARAERISATRAAGNSPIDPASFVASRESGKDGSRAVGFDANGGTSYGKFQISSKAGTFDSFIKWLDGNGYEGVASELRSAGDPDSGSRDGTVPNAWRALVESAAITDEMQERFIRETHFDPAMRGAPDGLREAAEGNNALQAAIFSTAVQHGPAAARRLMHKAWDGSDGDPDTFLYLLYEERKTQFPSSDPQTRASVAARLDAEVRELAQASWSPLSPSQWESEHRSDLAEINRRQNEKSKELSIIEQTSKNVFAQAINSSDFSRFEELIGQAEALGGSETAADMRLDMDLYLTARPFVDAAANMPFVQQYGEVQAIFNDMANETNAERVFTIRDQVLAKVQANEEAFRKDPFSVVAHMPGFAEQYETGGPVDETNIDYVQRNIAMQQTMAEGMGGNFTPHVMPATMVAQTKEKILDPAVSPAEKLKMLAGVYGTYGKFSVQAFRELGLPEGAIAAAYLATTDPDRQIFARDLLAASLMKDGDIPDNPNLSRADAKKAILENEEINYLLRAQNVLRNDEAVAFQRGMQDATANMLLLGWSKSLDELTMPFSYVDDPNVLLRIPTNTGLNADAITFGLNKELQAIGDILPEYVSPETVESIRQNAVWMNTGDGKAVLIFDRKEVASRDGGPISFDMYELQRRHLQESTRTPSVWLETGRMHYGDDYQNGRMFVKHSLADADRPLPNRPRHRD